MEKRHFEPDTANVAGNGEKCFIRRITFREAVDITGGERRKRHNDNKQYLSPKLTPTALSFTDGVPRLRFHLRTDSVKAEKVQRAATEIAVAMSPANHCESKSAAGRKALFTTVQHQQTDNE